VAVKRPRFEVGVTLIEITVSMVVLLIATLGVSAFRYKAALCSCKVDLRVASAQIALLLCDGWCAARECRLARL